MAHWIGANVTIPGVASDEWGPRKNFRKRQYWESFRWKLYSPNQPGLEWDGLQPKS